MKVRAAGGEAPPNRRACCRECIQKGGHPTLSENCPTGVLEK